MTACLQITGDTMQELRKLLGAKRPIPFIAVAHTDHSNTPHVHALAILRTYLSQEQLGRLRGGAEQAVVGQGVGLSQAQKAPQENASGFTRTTNTTRASVLRNPGLRQTSGDIFVASATFSASGAGGGGGGDGGGGGEGRGVATAYSGSGRKPFICPACNQPSGLRKVDTYFECNRCGMEIGRPRILERSLSFIQAGEDSYSS